MDRNVIGPGLGREDGETDGAPPNAGIAFQIMPKRLVAAGPPEPIERDRQDGGEEDEVIEPVHENRTVKR